MGGGEKKVLAKQVCVDTAVLVCAYRGMNDFLPFFIADIYGSMEVQSIVLS